MGQVKGLLSHGTPLGESWTTALSLTELGQKAACQKNTLLLIRRSHSLFLGVMVKKGVADGDNYDDE